jgi:hypothetical protein
MRTRLATLLIVTALGCAGDSDRDPGPPPIRDTPPAAPADNDPAYAIDGMRDWYLIGNAITPDAGPLRAQVTAPDGVRVVDAWVAGAAGVRLDDDRGRFVLEAPIGHLPPGVHEVLLSADGADTAFARLELRRSHPLYVLATTDWDFSDPSQQALDFHDRMHTEHPGIKITHFIGPYSFTDPDVSATREAELVAWARRMRDDHGDELGLHIHPYCHFVEYAGLVCNIEESTVYGTDSTGYTVGLWAYGDASFRVLLEAADQLFVDRGLGKPVTFRAGGWTATIETLRALAATGYVADTSANNWARMEEWNRPRSGILYQWNRDNWATIGDTSQPYYPNDTDVLSFDEPTLSILEVPDNAIMVDYVTIEEMTEIFEANWDGAPLEQPTTYVMGWHPAASFGDAEKARVDGLFDLTDQYLADDDLGPVVYALMRDMPAVWTRD